MNIRIFVNIILITLTVLYPVGVYFGLQYIQPRYLILVLVSLVILRLMFTKHTLPSQKQQQSIFIGILGLFTLIIFISNQQIGLLLYPVVVSLTMLALFSYSLFFPPSMIERLARLSNPNMPTAGINYTRKVTMVWCVFFIFNSAISAYTALFTDITTWTLYNGLISYILMGSLFVIEYAVRYQFKKRHP